MHSIGRLGEGDRAAWETLYRAYAEFYERPMCTEILDAVWRWIFDEGVAFYALAARGERQNLIGFLHYRAMPSPLRGGMIGFADDLYVHPDFRGRGVADALFAALREQAKRQGWPIVRWITAADNHRARSVYDKVATKTDWQTYEMTCR